MVRNFGKEKGASDGSKECLSFERHSKLDV